MSAKALEGTAREGNRPPPTPVWKRCVGGGIALAILAVVHQVDSASSRPWIALGLVVVIALLAAAELLLLLQRGGHPSHLALGVLGAAALTLGHVAASLAELPARTNEAVLLGLFVLLLAVEVLRGDAGTGPPRVLGTLFVLVYVAAFSALIEVLLVPPAPLGLQLAFLLVLTAKSTDIGGYLLGKAVGGKKLLPKVSPGKTWSGFAGGTALAVLVAVVGGAWLATQLPLIDRVAFGLLLSLAAPLGDLAESLLKRWLGVKDSSGLVPTFGGMLDLIDSLVLAAPVGYWFLVWRGVVPP